MEDSDDSSSETSGSLYQPEEVGNVATPIVQDLTDEDKFLSDTSSLSSTNLKDGPPEIKPRPYQLEMFKESLERNIIVAMDTGSGKTHIAVMRIIHELNTIGKDQFCWFLAPTVYLCAQQYEYIKSQVSAVEVKFLSGADGVDRWTEQSHWDAVLLNVKVVVSTYQILLDALSHGFVQMASLALIVFDEAHNCVEKHPGALIMGNFYRRNKALGSSIPHILGLTASPVMKSSTSSVVKIEQTMDAICRSPSKHRAELRLQVKLPALCLVRYSAPTAQQPPPAPTKMMIALAKSYHGLQLRDDPYYLSLLEDDSDKGRRKLEKVRLSEKTPARDQVKSFTTTADKIWSELGSFAADYYISEVVRKVIVLAEQQDGSKGNWDTPSTEKLYISGALRNIELNNNIKDGSLSSSETTDKVEKMVNAILESPSALFSGIVFVQERAVASVLAKLLSIHPMTCRFNIGVMVGSSTHSQRARNIGELIDLDEQKDVLSKFKKGKLNLLIATSVMEEGIDAPACNLVLSFHRPANLKSFVQRRGRARHRDSRLVLLLSESDKIDQWQQLEADMRKMYEDEMRTLQELVLQEDAEEVGVRTFHVQSTNALLDLDNAVSHLYHFCSTLPRNEYVDLRPEFICTQSGTLTTATVILPLSVDEAIRRAESRTGWLSEKNAIKDAAFEAYIALYHAGLVNDNLLPLLRHDPIIDELRTLAVETRASTVTVGEQLNPWIRIAKSLQSQANGILGYGTVSVGGLDIDICMPVRIPCVPSFVVHWNLEIQLPVTIQPVPSPQRQIVSEKFTNDTWTLLQAGFGARYLIKEGLFPIQFASRLPGTTALRDMLVYHQVHEGFSLSRNTLIIEKHDPKVIYTFEQLLGLKPDIKKVQYPLKQYQDVPATTPHLSLKRMPKRNDFLHRVALDADATKTKKEFQNVLPVDRCIVSEMPFEYVQFGRLIPSIMHRLEISLVAEELSNTLLRHVQISDPALILTAICASSAREDTNYQRLEFLGDSILKLCSSIQLIAEYPLWHEGYLSAKKDRLVSNSRLSRAAMEIGLDKYIITKAFTGNKWRPKYVEDLLSISDSETTRKMSTKVLADVVEALVGAAMVDGGFPKALVSLGTFLPEIDWNPLEERRRSLHVRTPKIQLPVILQPLEKLIGHTFSRKAFLVEAMTHASCNSGSGSFERLEFLGDSILDNIIVTAMWPHNLSHFQMHLLRTALVNAGLLAFVCMEWSIEDEIIDLQAISPQKFHSKIKETHKTVSWPLWRFMRHLSPKLGFEQTNTAKRFSELRHEIKQAIQHGTHYPWALLSRLRATKYYSDIVESLLGAVWIDCGSFDVCKDILYRMGILPYFERILRDNVELMHPKERLGILADEKTVRYVMEKNLIDNEGVEGEEQVVQYTCTIFVGDERVISLSGCFDKAVLQTMAAEKAVEILGARVDNVVVGDKPELDMEMGRSEMPSDSGINVLMTDD